MLETLIAATNKKCKNRDSFLGIVVRNEIMGMGKRKLNEEDNDNATSGVLFTIYSFIF